jgi:hypothetical protein
MQRVFVCLLCIAIFTKTGLAQLALPGFALNHISSIRPLSLPNLSLPEINQIHMPPRGNGVTRIDDVCITGCSIILPLSALELQGLRLNNEQVALNWKTKNEIDSKSFDIERSLGDPSHFTVVGAMPSNAGTAAEKKYVLTDLNSFSGLSYYRIKQIDMDGHFAYSNTIQVRGYNTKESVWLLPNPASTVAVLYCYTATKGNYQIKVLSANGQTVYTQKRSLNLGSNNIKLPVQTLVSGIYYVQIIWPDGHHNDLKMAVE